MSATIGKLHGIDIFVDNRIKYGTLLPHKTRKHTLRGSKATIDRLSGLIATYNDLSYPSRYMRDYYDHMFISKPKPPTIGHTTA